MAEDLVKFQLRGKTFEFPFNRKNLQLGKILFFKNDENGFRINETYFAESIRTSVNWIAASNWVVTLVDSYDLEISEIISTQKALEHYMSPEDVLINLSYLASKLRIEKLYRSSEYIESTLRKVFAVVSRIQFIESLKSEKVSRELFHNWEPVIVYHLLTCFDLLGQPDEWMTFENWLVSKKTKSQRESVETDIHENLSTVEISLLYNRKYTELYGVKNSFFRFIREVLPESKRRELFESIKIHTNSIPPVTKVISEDATDEEKERFLFSIRNDYTHKVKVIPGIDFQSQIDDAFTVKSQEIKSDKWSTFMTRDWPNLLEHIVKSGLAEFLKRQNVKNERDFQIQKFTFKYYRAFKPDGSLKDGINRILFNYRDEEITREFVPQGLPEKEHSQWATIEEIDKNGKVYPGINRQKLTEAE